MILVANFGLVRLSLLAVLLLLFALSAQAGTIYVDAEKGDDSRLMPFGDRIQRKMALEALLRSIRLTAIPENAVEEGAPIIESICQPAIP